MRALIVFVVLALGGCSSQMFANRVSMSLAEDEAYVNSMYGPIGVTSKIAPQDAEVLREMRRLRSMVEAIMRVQAQQQRDGRL